MLTCPIFPHVEIVETSYILSDHESEEAQGTHTHKICHDLRAQR